MVVLLAAIGATVIATGAAANSGQTLARAPGYSPCLPVVSDLDCGQIPDSKKPIRVTGSDQYRLDRDGDGVACEINGRSAPQPAPPSGRPAKPRYRLSLEKPLGTPIRQIRRGEKFRVLLWSPNLPVSSTVRFGLCVNKTRGEQCYSYKSWTLRGGYRRIGFWTVSPNEGRYGILTITLKIDGRRVASKTLKLLEK